MGLATERGCSASAVNGAPCRSREHTPNAPRKAFEPSTRIQPYVEQVHVVLE
jgi:hypothetical protein